MNWSSSHNGSGYTLMVVAMAVLLALVAAAVLFVARRLSAGTGTGTAEIRPTAQQILDERFARGEIDDTEYNRRLTTLRDQSPACGLVDETGRRVGASDAAGKSPGDGPSVPAAT